MAKWITCFGRTLLQVAIALALGALVPDARAQDEVPPATSFATEVVLGALSYLGVPYRYGGNDPVKGFDCSGLVRHVYLSAAALELPRNSHEMARIGAAIDKASLEAGDLVFFDTRGRPHSHVGIYIGDGRFVHAPARRGEVRIEQMQAAYWQRRYNGARRVLAAGDLATARSTSFAPGPMPPECASCEP